MRTVEEIMNEIDSHYDAIKKLKNERAQARLKDILVNKLKLGKTYYKFRNCFHDDMEYFGVATAFWFSETESEYVFEFTGFGSEHTDFFDGNWFSYDAQFQWYINEAYIDKFLNHFEEITEEEFLNEFDTRIKKVRKDMMAFSRVIPYEGEQD